MQQYLWPKFQAPTAGAHDRFVNIAKPEGILIVAAGGPGMAETWLLMPHLAFRIHETSRAAMLAQLPLAVLMVAYTVLGLWLLSTPAVG